jgi:alpha-tubulin suppressor-like RCC1 family protein
MALVNSAQAIQALPLVAVQQIAAGVRHACATSSAGAMQCCGENSNGQLGNGRGNYLGQLGNNNAAVFSSAVPVSVVAGSNASATGIASITAGEGHTRAQTSGGNFRCWAGNPEATTAEANWATAGYFMTPTRSQVYLATRFFPAGLTEVRRVSECIVTGDWL